METQDAVQKLEALLAQKKSLEEIIAADPTNAQFQKLFSDLEKLIELTSSLVSIQQDEGHAQEESDDNGSVSDLGLDGADSDSRPISTGSMVEVVGGDRPYAAVVVDSVDGDTYKVKYFEFEAEVILPLANLKAMPKGPLAKEDVDVGFKGQCKFSQDQLFYDAVVTALTAHGAIVSYPQYGNSEEVPIAYLRPLVQKQKKAADPHVLIKIPDNLKILPTDTEEEKARKKKKIKAIKSKNRLVTKEAEVSAVQNSWKKFVTKTSKKVVGGMTKTSMFASPEEVEGRVGVTNSGKGLTDFASRSKHKF